MVGSALAVCPGTGLLRDEYVAKWSAEVLGVEFGKYYDASTTRDITAL